ncbi:MAG TPA: ATP-grasp domain-containing protein [Bacteroidales bacterium]|nr:ATP-grasp domain-containing protein [Bacteroidales bacterium]HQJ21399.1 ATP-grasp domain-containing protein [Bacteroidales bacterium]
MKKSILIFGGGLNQYLLIKTAKDLDYISVVIDPLPDAPGKEIADFFYVVDGKDYETTKKVALKHSVSAIVTTQMEKPLRIMAKLAQDLQLQFHSPEVVERSLNKWLMKQQFLKNNIPCANGKLFLDNQGIREKDLNNLSFPLIMKPIDATSSQGVYKVENFNEIKKYENSTRKFSRNNGLIIEEFLDGPEYSIESITYKGHTTVCQFTEKFITPFPNTVEMGHLQPADLTFEQKGEIKNLVIAAINAIGIDNSASHTEVKLTKQGAKIVEIGARGGGDFISSYLILTSTGINMDEAIIKVALGESPDLLPKCSEYAFIKYFDLPVGKRVIRINDWAEVFEEKDIVFVNISIKPGDIIEKITESKKRPGFIIVKGETRDKVLSIAEDLTNSILTKIILD